MTVWVYNPPDTAEKVDFVYASLKKGISRYGWSFIKNGDLTMLSKKGYANLNSEELNCYNRTKFLSSIEKGDWIVHVNVPKWGECTAGVVKGTYKWDDEPNKIGVGEYSEDGDLRATIELDINTIIEFNRKDPNITPYVRLRLGLMGAHWRIHDTDEFMRSVDNLRKKTVDTKSNVEYGLYYLKEDFKPHLNSIAMSIHKNHPGKSLEQLIALIFENVPNVINVKANGSGFGTDYGADLIVTYSTGLPIDRLQTEKVLVPQIKSFSGVHYETDAVEQIETAIKKYDADVGLIISTATASTELMKRVETAQDKMNVPIALMCGEEVAAFILKYGSEYVL